MKDILLLVFFVMIGAFSTVIVMIDEKVTSISTPTVVKNLIVLPLAMYVIDKIVIVLIGVSG